MIKLFLVKRNILKKYKTDNNFRFVCKTRRRIHQALQRKIKTPFTKEFIGMDVDSYRKWIDYQMTPEMNWTNFEIDHLRPISSFDISKDEELREAFNWKNTQPFLKHDHHEKGTKYKFSDYQLQFIRSYQFS